MLLRLKIFRVQNIPKINYVNEERYRVEKINGKDVNKKGGAKINSFKSVFQKHKQPIRNKDLSPPHDKQVFYQKRQRTF